MTEIICSLIAALGGILGSFAAVRKGRREDEVKMAKREQQQTDRLTNIEKKLDVHNGYAEKLGAISQSMVAMQRDIEWLKDKTK